MSVLALGLALRTVNNGLGLIGQYLGLGLVSLGLGLSHRGFDFECTRFTSFSKQAWMIINIEYFIVFNILVRITNIRTSLPMSSIFYVLFTYLLTEVCFTLKLLAWSSCGLGLALRLSWQALQPVDVDFAPHKNFTECCAVNFFPGRMPVLKSSEQHQNTRNIHMT